MTGYRTASRARTRSSDEQLTLCSSNIHTVCMNHPIQKIKNHWDVKETDQNKVRAVDLEKEMRENKLSKHLSDCSLRELWSMKKSVRHNKHLKAFKPFFFVLWANTEFKISSVISNPVFTLFNVPINNKHKQQCQVKIGCLEVIGLENLDQRSSFTLKMSSAECSWGNKIS